MADCRTGRARGLSGVAPGCVDCRPLLRCTDGWDVARRAPAFCPLLYEMRAHSVCPFHRTRSAACLTGLACPGYRRGAFLFQGSKHCGTVAAKGKNKEKENKKRLKNCETGRGFLFVTVGFVDKPDSEGSIGNPFFHYQNPCRCRFVADTNRHKAKKATGRNCFFFKSPSKLLCGPGGAELTSWKSPVSI